MAGIAVTSATMRTIHTRQPSHDERLGAGVAMGMLVTPPPPKLLCHDCAGASMIVGASPGAPADSITTGAPLRILMTKRRAWPGAGLAPPLLSGLPEMTCAWSAAGLASDNVAVTAPTKPH